VVLSRWPNCAASKANRQIATRATDKAERPANRLCRSERVLSAPRQQELL